MKKSIVFGITLLSFLVISPSLSSTNGPNVRVASGGMITYSTHDPLTLHQYTFYNWQISASQYAACSDVIQIHYDNDPSNPTLTERIHAIRANYIGLLYRNVHKIYSSSPENKTFFSNNWILKYSDRNPVPSTGGGWIVDIGNSDYQSWLAEWIYDQTTLHGYEGTFCDDGFGVYRSEIWWDTANSSNIINPRTGVVWTDQEVRDALVGVYTHLRTKMGSLLIVANGIFDGDRWQTRKDGYTYILNNTDISGVMGEAWWWHYSSAAWMSESSWKNSLDSLVEYETSYVKNNASKMFVPACLVDLDGNNPMPPGTSYTQMSRYGFASTLLGIQSSQDYLAMTNNGARLSEFYSNLFSINVGYPTGNYSLISGTHVYQRNYTNIKVLVNPTGTAYDVTLSGTYRNLNGQNVTRSITMPAHTGEILTLATPAP